MLNQLHTKGAPEHHGFPPARLQSVPDLSKVFELTEDVLAEALSFLAVRPVHTVVMTSFIHDNGFNAELNRGVFYGYRGQSGKIEGIALIGHSTLVETRSDAAMRALAFTARTSRIPIHLIMAAGDDADSFWSAYSGGDQPRLRCEELLFEASLPFLVQNSKWDVQEADISDLEQIAEAQAAIAFMECGVDPMARDREGFLSRVARRIEQKRIFTVVENGVLIFKADVIAEAGDVVYLEGVFVAPSHRGQGVGSACLAKLTVDLLGRFSNICLLSNVEYSDAHRSFRKAGYASSDKCITLFV